MDAFTATMIVEGVEEVETRDQYVEAMQFLIDTGLAWKLQGFFGRTAAALIDSGDCVPAGR